MFERLFSPRAIAVIGASRTPGKLGYEVLRNCIEHGFQGKVFPVNPYAQEILSLPCVASVEDIAREIDVAVIVVPREQVYAAVEACGKKGVPFVVIITAGFRETGDSGRAEEERILALARSYDMRIVGPNCLGFISPYIHLNASFTQGMPKTGGVALISQSGAMCVSILDWAQDVDMGFSSVLTIGNGGDVTAVDALEYALNDKRTRVIALYVESVTDGERLLHLARKSIKPIVLIKSGVSSAGSKAVQSHTGALAGDREAVQALCQKAGIIQVQTVQEFFDVTLLLSTQRMPQGPRVTIVTNAGGPGVLTVDSMERTALSLAQCSPALQRVLRAQLPVSASVANPIDIIGDAPPARYAHVLKVLRTAPTDALVVILTPQVMTDPISAAQEIVRAYRQYRIPILCSFMGGGSVHDARVILNNGGVPHVSTPERAIRALDILVQAEERKKIKKKYPQLKRTQKVVNTKQHPVQMTTQAVEGVLSDLGLKHVRSILLRAPKECVRIRRYPVVMKIASRDVIHKSAAGGVVLPVRTVKEARSAYVRIRKAVRTTHPHAKQEGVLVQPLLQQAEEDIELFIGLKKDPVCGTLILCGAGGTAVEFERDIAYALAPLSHREAMHMLTQLRCFSRMTHNDVSACIDALVKISQFGVEYTGFSSFDVNPLILHREGRGYTILDARILL